MARERYLVGAGEDTIHSGVIELNTASDKRKNWWYYHKRQLLFGVIVAAIVISVIYSIVSKVEPDYTVGLLTSYNVPSEVLSALEDYLQPYADDRNGDGKVVLRISNYVFGDMSGMSDPQTMQASYARFAGDASMGSAMIYIHDETAFKNLGDSFAGFFQYNDGTPMPENAWDFENAMRPLSDFKAFDGFSAQGSDLSGWTPEVVDELFSRLRVSVRTKEGSAIENDKKQTAYYEDSMELFQRLETGEKLVG